MKTGKVPNLAVVLWECVSGMLFYSIKTLKIAKKTIKAVGMTCFLSYMNFFNLRPD